MERNGKMYKEVNKNAAVEIYMSGGSVFAGTGQSLDRLGGFTLEAVKNRPDIRFVADVEEKQEEEEKLQEEEKKAEPEEPKEKKETVGEMVARLREEGFSNREIAEKLSMKTSTVSQNLYLHNQKKKKQAEKAREEKAKEEEWDEPEEEDGPRLKQKTIKLNNSLNGGEKSVDLAKAQALLEAGWTVEKIADEFNVYPEELEKALETYRKESN